MSQAVLHRRISRMMNSYIYSPVRLGVAVAFLCLVMPFDLLSESFVNAWPREALVGSWSGVAKDRISFLRLELNNDGTGRIADTHFTFEKGEVFVTPILSWQLKDGEITCQLGQSGFENAPETLQIKWDGTRACLLVVLKGPGWSEEARLCSDARLKISQEKISRALGQKPGK